MTSEEKKAWEEEVEIASKGKSRYCTVDRKVLLSANAELTRLREQLDRITPSTLVHDKVELEEKNLALRAEVERLKSALSSKEAALAKALSAHDSEGGRAGDIAPPLPEELSKGLRASRGAAGRGGFVRGHSRARRGI